MTEIKDKIREARKKAGMTQEQLALKVGTTKQNIGNYERGVRNPKIDTLAKIASALGVPIEYFLEIQTFNNWNELKEVPIEELEQMIKSSKGGISIETGGTGKVVVSHAILDDIKIKDKIINTLDDFNHDGLTELQRQIWLLSHVPDFKKKRTSAADPERSQPKNNNPGKLD